MGVKLIILLALLIGVLYCVHLLVKDYQAVTAGSRLLRFLRFKRDLNSKAKIKSHVRWKKILRHDPLQCVRVIFCHLGSSANHTEVQKGFVYMLTLEPTDEDKGSHEEVMKSYSEGVITRDPELCRWNYAQCPFKAATLFELIEFLLKNPISIL